MKYTRISEIVIPVSNLDKSTEFYSEKLGLEISMQSNNEVYLSAGNSRIRLVNELSDYAPKAYNFTHGSVDLSLTTELDVNKVLLKLGAEGVTTIKGPVNEVGPKSAVQSVYLRDPDKNLVRISSTDLIDLDTIDKQPDSEQVTAPDVSPGLRKIT